MPTPPLTAFEVNLNCTAVSLHPSESFVFQIKSRNTEKLAPASRSSIGTSKFVLEHTFKIAAKDLDPKGEANLSKLVNTTADREYRCYAYQHIEVEGKGPIVINLATIKQCPEGSIRCDVAFLKTAAAISATVEFSELEYEVVDGYFDVAANASKAPDTIEEPSTQTEGVDEEDGWSFVEKDQLPTDLKTKEKNNCD